MQSHGRPIEIFAPFNEALDLTKKILFQPFDLMKWLVIGFAAWLATFFSGGRYHSYHTYTNHSNWDFQARHFGPLSMHESMLWIIPLVGIGLLFGIAIVSLFLWLNARGVFIFTDCIVRNRAAIVEPWTEYRAEGNSLFLFHFCVVVGSVLLFSSFGVIIFFAWSARMSFFPTTLFVGSGLIWVLLMILFSLFSRFMVAVMYRQRCRALAAFGIVWRLFLENIGVFILFELFFIVIWAAAIMIGCVAGCVTCCVAALPYVGTVILLPVVMPLFAFPLTFLRQFGDAYDVFAVLPATLEPPPVQIPPAQEPPPAL